MTSAFAFTVVLTFLVGTTDVRSKELHCGDWPCVQRLALAGRASAALIRLRVFDGKYDGQESAGNYIWAPLVDEWFN